jgi:aldehyde dehydrogenase (NAD+)
MKNAIQKAFGDNPLYCKDLASIINLNRWDALHKLLDNGKIAIGGKTDRDKLRIEPTVLEDVDMEMPIMKEEIFGPILPVLEYQTKGEVLEIIKQNSHPLAFYIFSNDKAVSDFYFEKIPFGGGIVNDAIVHLANPHLPFGGVGTSGYGNYHGKFGFDIFSHAKAMMKAVIWFDLKQRYAPYSDGAMRLIKRLMR